MTDPLQAATEYAEQYKDQQRKAVAVTAYLSGVDFATGGESDQSHMVLIERTSLDSLREEVKTKGDIIAFLQAKEVEQDKEFQEIAESLQRKQTLLNKAWNDYDQLVKELTKERAKITKLEEENARLLKAFKAKASKPNVFKRIWKAFVKWFKGLVGK